MSGRPIAAASKYAEAARAIRGRQLAGRALRLIPPAVLVTGCSRGRPSGWRPISAPWPLDPAPQSGPLPAPDSDRRFRAFGSERDFSSAGFWSDPTDGLLFSFHLHGFSDLLAYAAGPHTPAGDAFWEEVVGDWLAANRRAARPGWHPYPTSERVIAWIVAISTIGGWPAPFRDRVAAEIWRQARYLARTVEHDIGGNHVLRNATAIALAGTVYPGSGLLRRGMLLLEKELARQILPDGGHEERSTSYHRRISAELTALAAVLEADANGAPEWLIETAAAMKRWQHELAGPDGDLPPLNDGWSGPPLRPTAQPEAVLTHLADSGYLVLRANGDQAILDLGPIAPPHLPAHGHADVFSFVLWSDGRPVLIDPGSYLYTGPWRDRFRGTAAHSTVEVDGLDQCEFWGDFRASGLPRVSVGAIETIDGVTLVDGCHDGYRRLAAPVLHRRTFGWIPGEGIVVVDRLDCAGPHSVRSTLRPAPEALERPDRIGDLSVRAIGLATEPAVRADHAAPHIGTMCRADAIEYRLDAEPSKPFGWSLLRPPADVIEVDRDSLTVRRRDGRLSRLPLGWSAPNPG